MVDEAQHQPEEETNDAETTDLVSDAPARLTQAARRERIAELAAKVSDRGAQDGDRVVIEAGEPVVLHLDLDRDGVYTATWWATQLTEHGHHRWRDAAQPLLGEGEAIYTSALGGGYLVEIERSTRDEATVIAWIDDSAPSNRVRELLTQFPESVAALPVEPVPDYLIPPEPEAPDDERDANED
jgi:hypothetical protein